MLVFLTVVYVLLLWLLTKSSSELMMLILDTRPGPALSFS